MSIEGRPVIAKPVPELAKDSISLLEKLIVTESEVVALEEKPKSKIAVGEIPPDASSSNLTPSSVKILSPASVSRASDPFNTIKISSAFRVSRIVRVSPNNVIFAPSYAPEALDASVVFNAIEVAPDV